MKDKQFWLILGGITLAFLIYWFAGHPFFNANRIFMFVAIVAILNPALCNSLRLLSEPMPCGPYFSQRTIPQKLQRVDALKYRRIRDISLRGIFAYFFYVLWNYSRFYFFRLRHRFSKKIQLDVLLDVSRAENGYARGIHRDSDSRYIVF